MNAADRQFEARCSRIDRLRVSTQDRHVARLERLERLAQPLVGLLCRGGRDVFYVSRPGFYFESPSETAVIDRIISKRFVR